MHLQQLVGMPHVIILLLGACLCHGLQSRVHWSNVDVYVYV